MRFDACFRELGGVRRVEKGVGVAADIDYFGTRGWPLGAFWGRPGPLALWKQGGPAFSAHLGAFTAQQFRDDVCAVGIGIGYHNGIIEQLALSRRPRAIRATARPIGAQNATQTFRGPSAAARAQ